MKGDPVGRFDCGVDGLNSWLRTLALRSQRVGGARTFVSMADDGSIAAYYSLSAFSVVRALTGEAGTAMPDPIPATLIGRLAVDVRFSGRGLGASMLQDAARRAVDVSLQIGSAAIIVHTRDETVVPFYERFGFRRLEGDRCTLMLPMTDAMVTLERLAGES